MPFQGGMMWRFSTLFNYIRGGVRSGAWRVRETPSQLVSDKGDDRDDQKTESPPAGPAPLGPPSGPLRAGPPPPVRVIHPASAAAAAAWPVQPVRGDLPSPRGSCGPSVRPGPRGRGAAGVEPGPSSVRLPPPAALWYLGLPGQRGTAGQGTSTGTAAGTAVTAAAATAGAPAGSTSGAAGSVAAASPILSHITPVSTHSTAPITIPATVTASTVTAISAPATAPITLSDSPSSSAPSPSPDSAGDDLEPVDSLSSLRISFAAEHDRLMAGLQNAAGAGVATSRPHQALECFRTAAALGSPAAWFNCGVCFQQGQGTDVDLEKAVVCYEEAVRLGHAAAGYNLALLAAADHPVTLRSGYDVTGLLERAVAAGSTEAAEFLKTWREWSEEEEEERESEGEGSWLSLSPPGRSVSLPVLRAGCDREEPSPDLERPWYTDHGDWPAVRQPVTFHLHESP